MSDEYGVRDAAYPPVARSRKVAAALGDVDLAARRVQLVRRDGRDVSTLYGRGGGDLERAAGRRDGRAAACEGAVGARVDLGAGRRAAVRLGRHREDGGSECVGRVKDR